MSIDCEVILRWSATPAQLRALGAAFWRWGTRRRAGTGIYQYLDSQTLADLIDGQFPASIQTPGQPEPDGPRFRIRDESSRNRQATIDGLRRTVPTEGLADILVDGLSWSPDRREGGTPGTL
jgi:hypothetical protein